MKKKRIFKCFIAAAILASAIPVAAYGSNNNLLQQQITATAPFLDIKGTWCEAAVETCFQTGILSGKTAEKFDPTGGLTKEQVIVIAARFYELLTGGDGKFDSPALGDPWFKPAYQVLNAAVEKNGESLPQEIKEYAAENEANGSACERQLFVQILAASLSAANIELPKINQITQIPDCLDTDVLAFYNAGIVNGTDKYGTLNGRNGAYLNRGQAAAILARIIDPSLRLKFSLEPFSLCGDILQMAPNTVLLSVNGIDYTAAQYGAYLLGSVQCSDFSQNPVTPEEMGRLINQTFELGICALPILAQRLGISLTDAELAAVAAKVDNYEGYYGLPKDTWIWIESARALYRKVWHYYAAQSPDNSVMNPPFYRAIWDIMDNVIHPTTKPSAAFDSIDMDALWRRARIGPDCRGMIFLIENY